MYFKQVHTKEKKEDFVMWTGKIRRWIAAVCLMSLCAAMASGCGSNGGEKGTGEEAVGLSAEELLDADWETIEAQARRAAVPMTDKVMDTVKGWWPW